MSVMARGPILLLALLLSSCASAPDSRTASLISLQVRDLTPQFLAFYDAAMAANAGPAQRWELWQQHYGFAAVPPTQEGREMARRMLEDAWPRYPRALRRIRAGADDMRPDPRKLLYRVAGLLGLDRPLEATLVAYVGAFEDNAFVTRKDERIQIALPVESEAHVRELFMAHEFAHAVHMVTADLDGGWERTIAETVMMEGLAIRAAQALFPGRRPERYMEHEPGWLKKMQQNEAAVLNGIRPHLPARDSETVFRFTMGRGSTGMAREASYVGWRVVGHLLETGNTLAQIARTPDEAMPALVDEVIVALLPSEHRR